MHTQAGQEEGTPPQSAVLGGTPPQWAVPGGSRLAELGGTQRAVQGGSRQGEGTPGPWLVVGDRYRLWQEQGTSVRGTVGGEYIIIIM